MLSSMVTFTEDGLCQWNSVTYGYRMTITKKQRLQEAKITFFLSINATKSWLKCHLRARFSGLTQKVIYYICVYQQSPCCSRAGQQ